jgi:hypothetical protein
MQLSVHLFHSGLYLNGEAAQQRIAAAPLHLVH